MLYHMVLRAATAELARPVCAHFYDIDDGRRRIRSPLNVKGCVEGLACACS